MWLLYLSSVLWLLQQPPWLLCPACGYVTQETDLNTVSTVIVPLNTVQCLAWHRGPLSDILVQCPLSSESHCGAAQLWQTVILSPVQHNSFSLLRHGAERESLQGNMSLYVHDTVQCKTTIPNEQTKKTTNVKFIMIILCWDCISEANKSLFFM